MASQRRSISRNPRATKACARCRKRKIKCDFVYPQCGTCVAAGVECLGFDATTGQEQPRSVVGFLEDKVAQLEIKLAAFQGHTPAAAGTPRPRFPPGDHRLLLALTLRNDSDNLYKTAQRGQGTWRSATYLSPSPLPTLQPSLCPKKGTGWWGNHQYQKPIQKRDIASIPRNVIDIMLQHYVKAYLIQYPILHEAELMQQCDRVYNRSATAFDTYVVCMALSISAHTLIRYDPTRAIKAADEFWESAVAAFDDENDSIWQQNTLTQLKFLMLMCHYSFANPSAADTVACSRAAMALCVQLGLHREPQPENLRSQIDVESQRRIFWTCYTLDAQNKMMMGESKHQQIRPPASVQYPSIQTTLPPEENSGAVANYLYTFRQLETEIAIGTLYPDAWSSGDLAMPTWLDNVRARMNLWRENLESQQAFSSKVEFRDFMFQFQRLRLNRVSPRSPIPSFGMRRECIAAATFLVGHYDRIIHQGGFFYWYHCGWQLFEAGIVLVESANTGLGLIEHGKESFLQPGDAGEFTAAMRSIPVILRSMIHRWPEVERMTLELEQVFSLVLFRLDKWRYSGEIIPVDEITMRPVKEYLLRREWRLLEEDDNQISSTHSAAMTESTMTMEEVFRVLQPTTTEDASNSPSDMPTPIPPPSVLRMDETQDIPQFFSASGSPYINFPTGFVSPTESSSLFWHNGGLELDDIFMGFNAGNFQP